MAGISDFLGKKNEDRVARFQRLSKDKTAEELRDLEKSLLRPDKIPTHTGKEARTMACADKVIKLAFNNVEEKALFAKYFTVTNYIEDSCYKLDMLVDFLKALDSGRIRYVESKRKFKLRPSVNS